MAITLPVVISPAEELGVNPYMVLSGLDANGQPAIPASGFPSPHKLGKRVECAAGEAIIWARATATITGKGYACLIDDAFGATMITTANSASKRGALVGMALAPMVTGDFGWFQIEGNAEVRVLASAVVAVVLNTTVTPGVLDDDATVGSRVISGVFLAATNGGTQANVGSYVNGPATVGATL